MTGVAPDDRLRVVWLCKSHHQQLHRLIDLHRRLTA